MNTIHNFLIETKKRIEDPKNWTQREFSKTKTGSTCSPDDPVAVCWCASGSLSKTFSEHQISSDTLCECINILNNVGKHIINKLNLNKDNLYYGQSKQFPVIYINDILGHKAVMELFDEAISKTENKA